MIRHVHRIIKHGLIPHEGNQFHPHVLRAPIFHGTAFAMFVVKIFLVTTLYFIYPDPTVFAEITTQAVFQMTNQARIEAGLPSLSSNSKLNAAAQAKAQHMLELQYFNHYGPNGETPWQWIKGQGYLYTWAGENLAMNFSESRSVVDAWMESQKHRENILNEQYQDIGLAAVTGKLQGRQTTILVQMFGQTYLPETTPGEATSPVISEGELQSGPGQKEIAGEQIEARLEAPKRWNPIRWAIQSSQTLFLGVLAFFGLAFLLNIFVRIRVQRGKVIFQSLFVLLIYLSMIAVKFHWLEAVSQQLKILSI